MKAPVFVFNIYAENREFFTKQAKKFEEEEEEVVVG